MSDLPPCPPSGEIPGCCLLAVPNTSTWQVVCPNTTQVHAVPTLTAWAGVLLAVLLVVAAFRRLR